MLAILTLVPFGLMIFLSFKENIDIVVQFWSWPERIKWENYTTAFEAVKFSIFRSIYVGVFSVAGVLLLGSLAGYAFARHRFAGKQLFYLLLLGVLMIPGPLILIPQYAVLVHLNLINSYWGLILPYIAGSQLLCIILCRSFFEELPEDLFEAGRMDGAGELYLYRRVALSLCVPILVSVAIVTFIAVYNDYILPLVVLKESKYTFTLIAVQLTSAGRSDMGLTFAAFAVGSIPMLVLIVSGMRYYVDGLLSGAVKS